MRMTDIMPVVVGFSEWIDSIGGEDINLTSNRLDEKFTENRLDELYSLVESETSAKKTLEEDFNVFSEEVSIKPKTLSQEIKKINAE